MYNYKSIQSFVEDEIDIRKSRFLTFLFPIEDEEDFHEQLGQIKKDHPKATHHCTAYVLNEDSTIQKNDDDGEPGGTAGIPMLEVLLQNELTYVAAVVVRYFGGIKLGSGGLIRAYSRSVAEALDKSQIIQNITQEMINLIMDYSQVDTFNYWLSQTDLPVTLLDTLYTDKVTFQLAIPIEDVEMVREALIERFSGQLTWGLMGDRTVDIPYP